MRAAMIPRGVAGCLLALALSTTLTVPTAQTQITPDDNKYAPADDVKLGRDAAAEATRELPMLDDGMVDDYVEDVGRDLVAQIPPEFRFEEFRYTFDVVDQEAINAFALPGGPMFLNRGMIEAAATEAEMAGVMAHEISHVALRHGTAQATKGQRFQIGALAGQVLGAIVGGTTGSLIAQGSQFGLGAYFLRYGRDYERQADLLGARILARAGYDPRQMANMFRTIEAQGGSAGPEWLSSHPNPGNRYDAIMREAASLRVTPTPRSNTRFNAIKARLDTLAPSPAADARGSGTGAAPAAGAGGTGQAPATAVARRIEPPAAQFATYTPHDAISLAVPANWRPGSGRGSVTYTPEGAVVQGAQGQSAFTHGVELGVMTGGSGNLQRDTDQLLTGLARSNPNLRRAAATRRDRVAGRAALVTRLGNRSDVTGAAEVVTLTTSRLRDGSLLYLIAVSPEADAARYDAAFDQVRRSIRLRD